MKKIVIITSSGGGGHVSVNYALRELLCATYHVESIDLFGDLLLSIDPVRLLTFGAYSGDDFYNYFIKKHAYRALNIFATFSHSYFDRRSNAIHAAVKKRLEDESPDIVISVCPYFNGYLATVTQQLGIPFLLVPTDLDMTTFLRGITPQHNHMYIALAFDDTLITQQLTQFTGKQIITGFPVKSTFTNRALQNHEQIFLEYNIPTDVPKIMIVMGAQGSSASYNFVKACAEITQPVHLIVCLGKNAQIASRIKNLSLPKHISMSLIGFTNRIADLMAISDVIITKSGSVSFCEGLYSGKPILLDATSQVLAWEQLNHTFVEKHGLGYSIKSFHDVAAYVERMLQANKGSQPTIYSLFGNQIGCQEILHLVDIICSVDRSRGITLDNKIASE